LTAPTRFRNKAVGSIGIGGSTSGVGQQALFPSSAFTSSAEAGWPIPTSRAGTPSRRLLLLRSLAGDDQLRDHTFAGPDGRYADRLQAMCQSFDGRSSMHRASSRLARSMPTLPGPHLSAITNARPSVAQRFAARWVPFRLRQLGPTAPRPKSRLVGKGDVVSGRATAARVSCRYDGVLGLVEPQAR